MTQEGAATDRVVEDGLDAADQLLARFRLRQFARRPLPKHPNRLLSGGMFFVQTLGVGSTPSRCDPWIEHLFFELDMGSGHPIEIVSDLLGRRPRLPARGRSFSFANPPIMCLWSSTNASPRRESLQVSLGSMTVFLEQTEITVDSNDSRLPMFRHRLLGRSSHDFTRRRIGSQMLAPEQGPRFDGRCRISAAASRSIRSDD